MTDSGRCSISSYSGYGLRVQPFPAEAALSSLEGGLPAPIVTPRFPVQAIGDFTRNILEEMGVDHDVAEGETIWQRNRRVSSSIMDWLEGNFRVFFEPVLRAKARHQAPHQRRAKDPYSDRVERRFGKRTQQNAQRLPEGGITEIFEPSRLLGVCEERCFFERLGGSRHHPLLSSREPVGIMSHP